MPCDFRFASFRDHVLLHIHMHNKPKHCNSFSSKSLKGQIWCVSILTLSIWIVGRITRAAPPTEMKKHIIYIENNPMQNSQIVIFCCKQHGLIEKVGHVPQSSIPFIPSSFPSLKRFTSRCPAANFESNTPLRSRSSKKLTKFPMAQSFQAHEPTRHCCFLRLSSSWVASRAGNMTCHNAILQPAPLQHVLRYKGTSFEPSQSLRKTKTVAA